MPGEEEIEHKQEVQRFALLCSGFTDMVDFEGATKKHGSDFYGTRSHAAAVRIQREKEKQKTKVLKDSTPKTDDADQVVLDARTAADIKRSSMGTSDTGITSDRGASSRRWITSPTAPLPSVVEGVNGPEKTAPSTAERIKDEL
ncbi:hypothetical protein EDB92DRAFT_1948210 [Lactarius akahatsu]|uniref:Uncharacterized protein n=1 Tax=Lactarius akahatsu TaxID=416441 RepID=A0AAD4LDQ3_9AGAM|nr:hypothetical protein EDB92DRAFT_1948210 [Lactarius akahatsu]